MKRTALYRAFNSGGELLYAGISHAAMQRFAAHRHYSQWFAETAQITFEWFDSRERAIAAEQAVIVNECPKFNVQRPGRNKGHPLRPANIPADVVIEAFGGVAALARALGHKNATTVQAWAINGIPTWRHHELLEAAKERKIRLSKSALAKAKKNGHAE